MSLFNADDDDKHKKTYYWRLHYNNVNRSEIRMMKFEHGESWAHFSDRISKKINLTADKILPLHYFTGSTPNPNPSFDPQAISMNDEEDYSICCLIMKSHSRSNDPEKGFDLYTKQVERYPYVTLG